jgi:hypothetical protein
MSVLLQVRMQSDAKKAPEQPKKYANAMLHTQLL